MTSFGAVLASIALLALTVEKIVSFIRNALDSGGKFPTYIWNVLAMVVGLGFALGWQLNLAPAILAMIPALKLSSALDGVSGQVLTGLAIGASAGFGFAILQSLEATVHRNNAGA